MWYNKSKFGFILRKYLNQKYLSDWKDTIFDSQGLKSALLIFTSGLLVSITTTVHDVPSSGL
jgi:hypothetical protein